MIKEYLEAGEAGYKFGFALELIKKNVWVQ